MALKQWLKRLVGRYWGADGGISDLRHPTAWLKDTFIPTRTTAGVSVTPQTSLTVGAYYRCLQLVSADVAQPEVAVMRKTPAGRERVGGHVADRLLNRNPNPEMTAFEFREMLTHWAMGWGSGVAWIERPDPMSTTPTALWPIHPSRVRRMVNESEPLGSPLRVEYIWHQEDGGYVSLQSDDVLDIHGMGRYSVAQLAQRALGLSIAAEEFGGAFFGNGAWASGALSHPDALGEAAHDNLRKQITEKHAGSANAWRPLILQEGMTWDTLTIPPQDAQFLEIRQFTIEEVARWNGVPPSKIGHLLRATFSNIEHQAIEYVTDAVVPWTCRWEHESDRKLLGPRSGGLSVHIDTDELIRGDSVQRAERTRTLISAGVMTPNEGRQSLGLNTLGPDGDKLFMQGAMAPLELIVDPPKPPAPVAPPPDTRTDTPIPPPGEGDGDDSARVALFERVAERFCRRETKAVAGAHNRADFEGWAAGWYATHLDAVHEEFSGLFKLYDSPDWDGFVAWIDHERATRPQSAASEDFAAGEPNRIKTMAGALHGLAARRMCHVEA